MLTGHFPTTITTAKPTDHHTQHTSQAVSVQEPHSEREHHKQCNHPTQKGSCHQRAHHTHSYAHTNPKRSMSDRCISTSQLHTLLRFHTWPINPIIYRTHLPTQMWAGNLISEQAYRLDAFSCYPSRTKPTSHAPGGTTRTTEIRPSRSSRTKDRPPQISYARRG